MRNARTGFLFLALVLLASCKSLRIVESEAIPEVEKTREAKMLTAFFGLDNDLPRRAVVLSRKAPGADGMPIVFSQELDSSSIDASDFEVTTADGSVYFPADATLKPANEAFELRTVLLIGEYGDYPENQPASIRLVGDLMSRAGQN